MQQGVRYQMKTGNRVWALLLTLCMVVSLFAGMTVTASAADGNPVTKVRVDGKELNAQNPSIPGASFDAATGTLTLENYQGGGILAPSGDLTIRVIGDNNHILVTDGWGIWSQHGTLTIQGAGTGAGLHVHSENTAIESYQGSLSVQGLTTLECSSTTPVNPIVDADNDMTFSDVQTVLVRGNTSYGAAVVSGGSMVFENINALQVLNDNGGAISAWRGLRFTNCGTVMAFSKNNDAFYVYCNYIQSSPVFDVERLVAYGGRYGVFAHLGTVPVDMTQVDSMVVQGGNEALHEHSASIQVPDGTTKTKTLCTRGQLGLATITLSNLTYTYGTPVAVTASAKDAATGTDVSLSYVYAWYDEAGTTPLAGAPTDAGTYTVKVYGFSDRYYSDLANPATAKVTINPADRADDTYSNTVGNGNNIYNLPAIPAGMHYGTPVVVSQLTGQQAMSASIGGSKLSVYAAQLTNGEAYTVNVPVERDEKANANYNAYKIVCTLTAEVTYPRFDLCDGSNVVTTGYTAPATDNAWASDRETATEFGYTFEGWYTAPNGWGNRVTTFEEGTTYFAHWVATRAVAGLIVDYQSASTSAAYVKFENSPKTIYTTGLDFTQQALLDYHASGSGYKWEGGKLTLTGLMINAGTTSTALTLPAGTTIDLEADPLLTAATVFYSENGQTTYTRDQISSLAAAYNKVRGGSETVPAFEAKGDLSFTSTTDNGCGLSLRGGDAEILGDLTLENGTWLSGPRIWVYGSASISSDAAIITENRDDADSGSADLDVGGDLTSTSDGMLLIGGDITAAGDVKLDGGTVLMATGNLFAKNASFKELFPGQCFCAGILCDEGVTLDSADLMLTGENELFPIFAETLSVTGDSELEIRDYWLTGISVNQMYVDHSTVKIQNQNGKEGALILFDSEDGKPAQLTLERARITTPGVSMVKNENGGMYAADADGNAASALTIEPYDAPSGGGYVTGSTVTVGQTEHGTITVTPKAASSGTTITITATPDAGYVLDSLTATDASGKQLTLTPAANGKYTFTMPGSAVTVNGTFRLRFTDIDPNAWYFGGVAYCLQNGLMDGVSETRFAPNGSVTRAQLVTMLWRLEKQPGVNYAMSFTDVAAEKWYTEAVRWAASEQLVDGVSEGSFAPDAPLTREQLVTILWRYAKYKGYDVSIGEDTNILSYDDAFDVASYAVPAMQWACGAGIITGANGKLLPKDTTSRAQIAVILQRFAALEK